MNDLIIKFNNNDEKAFKIIFDKYFENMRFYAYRITKDFDESEDVTIKCFHKLWKITKKFDSIKDVQFFLVKMIHNESLNYFKSKRYKHRISSISIESIDDINDEVINNLYENSLLMEVIFKTLSELPPKNREIMRLSFIEGLRDKDIIQRLNISDSNISTQKKRGITKIKETIKDIVK